jgi:uncharacterized protein YxjI
VIGQSLVRTHESRALARFGQLGHLSVRQRKRWLEILLSFEVKNAYDVFDEHQMPVLRVEEQGQGIGSFLKRIFFGPMRWFDAHVLDPGTRDLVLHLRRPFRFMFHELEVRDADGQLLGTVKRRWSWIRRVHTLHGPSGDEIANLFGPIFRPWTFEIRLGSRQAGIIQKKWSGFGKELFTDADNFRVELGDIPEPDLRALAFAATVLIDVVHFERAKG